jgi:hypothetical protein
MNNDEVEGSNIFVINNETESVPIFGFFGLHPDVGAIMPAAVNQDLANIPHVETINAPWVQQFLASFDMVRDQHVAYVRKF